MVLVVRPCSFDAVLTLLIRRDRRHAIHAGKPTTVAQGPGQEEPPDTGATRTGDRHRLTALQGLAALSLDAMASVAYGPESIVLVLAAAGAYVMGFTLPVTLAIAAMFASAYPGLEALNVMGLNSPLSAITPAIIFNALIIIALIPRALRGVRYMPASAHDLLRRNLAVYGLGGLVLPFVGIKAIDLLVSTVPGLG
ncbi:hypothetical protein Slala05_54520 [Streptomyces lavendulae subsp. lavendulae]|nr:hypothetical protein Slala05_54520 [Streptomyces lavendulae subsp. lavendulae]